MTLRLLGVSHDDGDYQMMINPKHVVSVSVAKYDGREPVVTVSLSNGATVDMMHSFEEVCNWVRGYA